MTSSADNTLRPELLDDPALPLEGRARALEDLERANRWLLGIGACVRTLLPRICSGQRLQTLLDLGSGTGQVSATLRTKARARGVDLRVLGVDRKLSHLLVARSRGSGDVGVVACASSLPFRSKSVDWTFSNLLFHHFSATTNAKIIGEMNRVARESAVVVDLRQSRVGRLLARLMLPILNLGPVARYDGKVSVDQAWRIADVRQLVGPGNIAELSARFPVRFSLVLNRDADLARPVESRIHRRL